MKQFIEKRPTAVSVIGWFWIIVGGFLAWASIIAVQQGPPDESLLNEIAKGSPLAAMEERHYIFKALFMFTVGDLAIIFGICFLRLYDWARTALEVVSWLCITLLAANMILGFFYVGGSFYAAIFLITVSAFFWVPLGLVIYFLRSKKVRDAVGGGGENGGNHPA